MESPSLSIASSARGSTIASQTTPGLHSDSTIPVDQHSIHRVQHYHLPQSPTETVENGSKSVIIAASHRSGGSRSKGDLKPFFAGESEGLDFLLDLCAPERPIKGIHYAVPTSNYLAKRSFQRPARPLPELPSSPAQQQLIRCFFHHVWPMLPIVDSYEFLQAYLRDVTTVSPLLLWSMFFTAANVSLHQYRITVYPVDVSSTSTKTC